MTMTATTHACSSPTSGPLPSLTLTHPTPPQSHCKTASSGSNGSTHTGSNSRAPRLLYRGALSLPDSHLLLDGLTFTIDVPTDDPQASMRLLETPLPLSLESMRGRSSLVFVGVEKMDEIYCDFAGGVSLNVHPRSILTHQLFTNHLCAIPVTSPSGRTELGIRIRLGDPDTECTTQSASSDIIVYGRPHASSSTMQLCVARIVPTPPPAAIPKAASKLRPPRPDDPIPRKPPAFLPAVGRGTKRPLDKGKGKEKEGVNDGGSKKKQKKDKEPQGALVIKASGSTKLALPKAHVKELGKNSRVSKGDAAVFKLPALPTHKSAERAELPDDDVFSAPAQEVPNGEKISELEVANKAVVKKAAVRLLAASGITKQHADFKEFFAHIYRGTGFALRGKMKSVQLDAESALVDRVVETHLKLYIHGDGS